MTDEQLNAAGTPPTPADDAERPAPTPEELLAETDADDPDVGVDGTGVGELP